MSLFGELRRRNVFKVGAAYAIVAWLLMEVTSVAAPALRLPEWTLTLIIFLVILGLPITLIMAWAYEMTPEGIKAAADVQPIGSVAPATGQRLNYFIVGLLTLAVGFLVVDRFVLEEGLQGTLFEVGGAGSATASIIDSARSSSGARDQPVRTASPGPVRRYATSLGLTEPIGNTGLGAHVTLSGDGRRLAYSARVDGETRLYVRDLDQFETRAIPGTEGAYHPFFSPDGEWLGFYSDETDAKLKKVSIRGGQPQTLADAAYSAGGSWVTDEFIVFATIDPFGGRGLFKMPATGGAPELLMESNAEVGYVTPDVLPGGEAVLFVARPGSGGGGDARDGRIAVLSLATGEYQTLIEGGYRPQYVPTGHIVFVRAGGLWVVPFDAERLETTGPEVPVVDGVQQAGFTGGAAYSFSQDGVLVYVPGGDTAEAGTERSLIWVDRAGREEPLAVEKLLYGHPRISPDGQRLAVSVLQAGNQDVWISDLTRGTSSRITFDPGIDDRPLWTPDGERVVFRSSADGGGLFWKAADGTGQAERLTESTALQYPNSFSPDGTELVAQQVQQGGWDIFTQQMSDQTSARLLIQTEFTENSAALSPDGHWLAYMSNETGREEVYVRPYPDVDEGKWQISRGGGSEPRWGPEARELFYRSGDAMLMVTVETEPGFAAGTPTMLFQGSYADATLNRPSYDVSHDGQRFLMQREDNELAVSRVTQLLIVENWFEELNRLARPAQ